MMTKEMILALLATAGNDLDVEDWDDEIEVTVNDFEGFDENWDEVDRELDNEELVTSIYKTLVAECKTHRDDFYNYFDFEGFSICWGYASFDI